MVHVGVWDAVKVMELAWGMEGVFVTQGTQDTSAKNVLTATTERRAQMEHSPPAQVTKHALFFSI